MASRVNDRLVADAVSRLCDGSLRFGQRNLYYAVCAILEPPEVTPGAGRIAGGVLLVVAGIVLGILASLYLWPLVPIGMVVTGLGLRARREARSQPTTRPLALGYDEFVAEVVEPRRGTPTLEAMLEAPPAAPADPASGTAVAATAVRGAGLVVCDRPETAAVLAANCAAGGLAATVAVEGAGGTDVAGHRVLSVHDADARGCGLPLRLRSAGAAEVVDLGLRPGHIAGHHVQVIEGAPLVVPAELSALLGAEEIVWLADGRRVELAVVRPRDLVDALAAALPEDAPARAVPGLDGVRLSAVSPLPPPG
jgi:hypothetical protein